MTSMRKLRRRVLRWRRYERRYYDCALAVHEGAKKALRRLLDERDRRNPYHGYGPCFCLGCIGFGRCEHDDPDDFDDSVCECDDCQGALYDASGYGDLWVPPVVDAPDISLYDAAVVQTDTQGGPA